MQLYVWVGDNETVLAIKGQKRPQPY